MFSIRQLISPEKGIVSIQYFRCLAVTAVAFHHCLDQFPEFREWMPTQLGADGVDLFFVISGFVMVAITEKRETSAGDFILRRILRIVPLYWIYTTLTALALLAIPNLFRNSIFTPRHYLLSLLFISHAAPNDPTTIDPLIKIGWTLNFEMFFYAIFAVAILVSARFRVALLAIAFTLLVAANHLFRPHGVVFEFYTGEIMLEFLFGALIGSAYLSGKLRRVKPAMAWFLIVAGLIGCCAFSMDWAGDLPRSLRAGAFAALIVIGGLALEQHGRVAAFAFPRLLGDVSYSTYLAHIIAIVIMRTLWARLGIPHAGLSSAIAFIVLGVTLAHLSGIVSYLVLERPILRWSRSRFARRPIAAQVSP